MKYKLVNRFNNAWQKLSEKYKNESRKHPERFVTTPRIAFHGTRQGNVPHIGMKYFVYLYDIILHALVTAFILMVFPAKFCLF